MIKIFLDESNPQAFKETKKTKQNDKTFYLQGILIRNEKNLKQILKKFYNFIQKHNNVFPLIYKPDDSWNKSVSCNCKYKTYLYDTTDNNAIDKILKEKEILSYRKNDVQLYSKFLRSIKENCEMFCITFSKEEREKNLMLKKDKNGYSNYKFYGGKYISVILPLVENVLISTGKIFNQFEPIEIILDRTNSYGNDEAMEAECFLKYMAGSFSSIKDWSRSTNFQKNERVWTCLENSMKWYLEKYKHKNCEEKSCDFCNNTNKYKHYKFSTFKKDMWYYNYKNNFNISFSAPQKNNEFLVIADWIGKVQLYNKKNKNKLLKGIKLIKMKKLITNNYAFTDRFLTILKNNNSNVEKWSKIKHKLFCDVRICQGCWEIK